MTRAVHGLVNVDQVDESYDWLCFCGFGCVKSPDPEFVWRCHVEGLLLAAPENIDRGTHQILDLDCGCTVGVVWPDFELVAHIVGRVVTCPQHNVGCCFHADVGVDGLPYFRRSDCPVVDWQ